MHGFRVLIKKPRFLPFSMRSRPSLLPNWLTGLLVFMYLRFPVKPFAGQMLFVATH